MLPAAPVHKPPKYAWDVLKKEATVQLAKQLNLLRVREESSSCLWDGNMWETSLTPVAVSLEEGIGKMQRDLTGKHGSPAHHPTKPQRALGTKKMQLCWKWFPAQPLTTPQTQTLH